MIKREELIKLVSEGKSKEAIDLIEESKKIKPKDIALNYYHASISMMQFNDESEQVIEELEYVSSTKNKFTSKALTLLTIIYSHKEEYKKAIEKSNNKYCEPGELSIPFYYALSVSYYQYNLPKSLEYINKCIELEPNEEHNLYILKADILLELENFDELSDTLDTMYAKFGANFIYYYLKAKSMLEKYHSTGVFNDQDYLEDIISEINKAEQYDDSKLYTKSLRAEVIALQGKTDEALAIIEAIKDQISEEEYVFERLKLFRCSNKIDNIKTEAEAFLAKQDSYIVSQILAKEVYSDPHTYEEYKARQDLNIKGFSLFKDFDLMEAIYNDAFYLNNYDTVLKLAKEYRQEYPDNPHIQYYIICCMINLNYSYDEIEQELMSESARICFSKNYYITLLCNYAKNPIPAHKMLLKNIKQKKMNFGPHQKQHISSFFLFGKNSLSVNYALAKEYIESAYHDESEDSCITSGYGNYYEVIGVNNKAFNLYEKGYQLRLKMPHPTCSCSDAYYAHALLNGIGTEKNVEEAKKVVLDSIKQFGDDANNTIIYLYTFFALNGDSRFDINEAKRMLELSYPFSRYEITKVMMYKCILKKLNQDTTIIDREIKNCLQYVPKCAKKFYKENKNKDIVYISPDDL